MRGIPHYDNVRPSLDIRKKLTSLLFFPLQRRNDAQAIVNAADITTLEKRNTRAMQNIFGAIKEITNPDDLQLSQRDVDQTGV